MLWDMRTDCTYYCADVLSVDLMKKNTHLCTFSQKRHITATPLQADYQYDYSISGSFSFNGKEKDWESGFHYYGARYYWSEVLTGWLSVDPKADKYPGISPYAYCGWNPVKLVDPDGMDGVPFIDKKNKTITVKADIIFYMPNQGNIGSGKINNWTTKLISDINKEWNSHEWTYNYEGDTYKVRFEFTGTFDNSIHGSNDFNYDKNNNRKNYIELSAESSYRYDYKSGKYIYSRRSNVVNYNRGKWYHDTKSAAHEAGHLLFQPDRYYENNQSDTGYGQKSGWEGTIMAEPGGMGHVVQKDVNAVLDDILK